MTDMIKGEENMNESTEVKTHHTPLIITRALHWPGSVRSLVYSSELNPGRDAGQKCVMSDE